MLPEPTEAISIQPMLMKILMPHTFPRCKETPPTHPAAPASAAA